MDKKNLEFSLYPIVVRQSRYSGLYEGGKWFAIGNHNETSLSEEYLSYISGDDEGALDFWNSEIAQHIGLGDTPDEAVENLLWRYSVFPDSTVYQEIRDSFDQHVENRKEHFTQKISDIMNIHIERTNYFEQSSGFKSTEHGA